MKKLVAQGNVITLPTETLLLGDSIIGGKGYLLAGGLFGVATATVEVTDIGQGKDCSLALTGIFDLPKQPSQAWSFGAKVYWDVANERATTTATGNTLIGIAMLATGGTAGETIGRVRLNGVAV